MTGNNEATVSMYGQPFEHAITFSPHGNFIRFDAIISKDDRQLMEDIFCAIIMAALSVFSSAANVINIIIFCKQGFNDPFNISLCALAVADLGSSLPLIWTSICFNPMFRYSDVTFDPVQVMHLTAGLPHGCFVRITSCITAFITFERCVCVIFPMKVKDIITPNLIIISIVSIFLILFASLIPVYYSVYFAPSFQPQRNKTLVGLAYIKNAASLQDISFTMNIIMQFSSVIIVIVCTMTLIHNLRATSMWRRNVTFNSNSKNSHPVSTRDKRVVKMVTLISSIFIVCYCPNVINFILMIKYSPEYSSVGIYQNSYQVSWAIINTLEVFNSSVSIYVYYNMSSKYRTTFKHLFGIQTVTVTVV